MNSKKSPKKDIPSPSLSNAPLTIFADQPAAFQVGPYTTKITLGLIDEEGDEYPRPVVTIAMPTLNLMRMVEDLHDLFKDPEYQKDTAAMLASDIKQYYSRGPTEKLGAPIGVKKTIKRIAG